MNVPEIEGAVTALVGAMKIHTQSNNDYLTTRKPEMADRFKAQIADAEAVMEVNATRLVISLLTDINRIAGALERIADESHRRV